MPHLRSYENERKLLFSINSLFKVQPLLFDHFLVNSENFLGRESHIYESLQLSFIFEYTSIDFYHNLMHNSEGNKCLNHSHLPFFDNYLVEKVLLVFFKDLIFNEAKNLLFPSIELNLLVSLEHSLWLLAFRLHLNSLFFCLFQKAHSSLILSVIHFLFEIFPVLNVVFSFERLRILNERFNLPVCVTHKLL